MTMLAFHNDPAVKEKYLARLDAHRKADEIIHGTYWRDGKGCAVGCTIHSNEHAAYERELGLPTWLARLEDAIFEALPNGESKEFPLRFLSSIKPGADVSGVRDQFLAWLMDDPKFGLAFTAREDKIKPLAAEVGRRLHSGEGVSGSEADALTAKLSAAWAARAARAAGAAWAAWAAWDARAAWAARDARAARDAWAAWAARDAWDAWATRGTRSFSASAAELLRLLELAPVPRPGGNVEEENDDR